jgi:hypothetical protein
MMKNKMMRIASVLLVAVLLSTCAISGTFAKYVTSKESTDTARVAKFGVDLGVTVDGAFATEYDADVTVTDKDGAAIAKTVVASSTDQDNLVAPGTKGDLMASATIAGTPEVAVNVKQEATLVLTGWEVNGTYYCPLVITVDGTKFYGMDYTSAAKFIADVEAALDSDVNYAPNTDLTESHSVTWAWAFEGTDGKQTDELDTALGNYAAKTGDIEISFTYKVIVTQID